MHAHFFGVKDEALLVCAVSDISLRQHCHKFFEKSARYIIILQREVFSTVRKYLYQNHSLLCRFYFPGENAAIFKGIFLIDRDRD